MPEVVATVSRELEEVPCGPVFLLPASLRRGTGPTAAWITAAGWASGAEQLWGTSWIVANGDILTPNQARALAVRAVSSKVRPPWRRRIPSEFLTLAKDVRAAALEWRERNKGLVGPWQHAAVPFVWQRHGLFVQRGRRLASYLDVPLVLSVHSLQVQEAAAWGVKRPGWESAVAWAGERPALQSADLVAAVSEEVAERVQAEGVLAERIVVTPNEVDLDHFSFDQASREKVRTHLALKGFVLGWAGSFRNFHGLEVALYAMAALELQRVDVTLLLVGEGVHRVRLEKLARTLGLERVVFAGPVPYGEMPGYLSAMDAALVLSAGHDNFHYSPVKLREYMGCARPVLAHRVGELERDLQHGSTAIMVDPNDSDALAQAIVELMSDPIRRQKLGENARRAVAARGGWQRPVAVVANALGIDGFGKSGV